MSVYIDNGYKNRTDYLECLADDFSVDYNDVECIAMLLGPNEDFDGLVVMVEDIADQQELTQAEYELFD